MSVATGSELDRPATIAATVYLSVLGASVFIVQPGFVQGLVQALGFSEREAGYVASAEVWGIAATTVWLALGGHRHSWRRILGLCALLFSLSNIASTLVSGFLPFSMIRFVAGIGAGGMVSVTFLLMGLTRLPDRNFGFVIMGVLGYGALGLWAIPLALASIGMNGVLLFFALFGASGLLCLRAIPATIDRSGHVATSDTDLDAPGKAAAVTAMFAYFLAQGIVWAYLFLIGTSAGIGEQVVANGLMLSQFFGIGGAFVATLLGARFGRVAPLVVGILGGALVLSGLLTAFGAVTYAVTVCAYNFAWNMTHPYLLASMASFDASGRLVSTAVAAQMIGLAVGPAVAAQLLQDDSYERVVWAAMAIFMISLLLIVLPTLAHNRRAGQPVHAAPQ